MVAKPREGGAQYRKDAEIGRCRTDLLDDYTFFDCRYFILPGLNIGTVYGILTGGMYDSTGNLNWLLDGHGEVTTPCCVCINGNKSLGTSRLALYYKDKDMIEMRLVDVVCNC